MLIARWGTDGGIPRPMPRNRADGALSGRSHNASGSVPAVSEGRVLGGSDSDSRAAEIAPASKGANYRGGPTEIMQRASSRGIPTEAARTCYSASADRPAVGRCAPIPTGPLQSSSFGRVALGGNPVGLIKEAHSFAGHRRAKLFRYSPAHGARPHR